MNTKDQVLEQKTLDVPQGCFDIAVTRGEKSILRTGNIGPCVAFCGLNSTKGVAFMAHVDGKVWGLGRMLEVARASNDGSLRGYSLFLTTNYTFSLRLGVLLASLIWLVVSRDTLAAGILSGVLLLGFSSIFQIYVYALFRFKTLNIRWITPWQFKGTVKVILDVDSGAPPLACRENLPVEQKKERYGPSYRFFWDPVMRPARPQAVLWKGED